MAAVVKETITTEGADTTPVVVAPVTVAATKTQTAEYVAYFLLGVIEILLGFRLVLKLLGANTVSAFVKLIYNLTSIFIWPFEGIFRRGFTEGIETTAVFEPSTLVAMIVYAILVWGIVQLVRVLSGQRQDA